MSRRENGKGGVVLAARLLFVGVGVGGRFENLSGSRAALFDRGLAMG